MGWYKRHLGTKSMVLTKQWISDFLDHIATVSSGWVDLVRDAESCYQMASTAWTDLVANVRWFLDEFA